MKEFCTIEVIAKKVVVTVHFQEKVSFVFLFRLLNVAMRITIRNFMSYKLLLSINNQYFFKIKYKNYYIGAFCCWTFIQEWLNDVYVLILKNI